MKFLSGNFQFLFWQILKNGKNFIEAKFCELYGRAVILMI